MTLAGGGGKDGFMRTMKHIGVGAQAWMEDMRKHTIKLDDETIEKLNVHCQEQLEKLDLEILEKKRNVMLTELLKAKEKATQEWTL